MPKREEDPTLMGFVIAFDPIEEERRYQEEEEARRLAKKVTRKKDDSSKCSGATASTSKSENTPVPDKIVTKLVEEEAIVKLTHKRSSHTKRKDMKKSHSEGNLLRKSQHSKKGTKKALKKAKKDNKKQAKTERRAARNIQRIARGYLVRRDLKQGNEEGDKALQAQQDETKPFARDVEGKQSLSKVEEKSANEAGKEEHELQSASEAQEQSPTEASMVVEETLQPESEEEEEKEAGTVPSKTRLGARLRRAVHRPSRKKEAAASRVQNAFRFFHVRKLFKQGDKQRWRTAWQRFFVFGVLSPLERMRQKQRLMQGMANVNSRIEYQQREEDDVSDSTDREEELETVPSCLAISPVRNHQNQELTGTQDLLDVIPENKTHCERVDHLLAPLPGFADSDDSSMGSDELMPDTLAPLSPSTVATAFTAASASPRRLLSVKAKNSKRGISFHSSCPALRFDAV